MPLSKQCISCKHYMGAQMCEAFDDIPLDIFEGIFDHRRPYPGDRGIRWEPAPGYPQQDDEETDA